MTQYDSANRTLSRSKQYTVIGAALLALFLGAMDALIVTAAMPTVVADLGGLHLFSWVYTTYFLSRAIALPIFGKLADLFQHRRLFLIAIAIFTLSSFAAGWAPNMQMLIITRIFQGIGSGGVFALVYIVLSVVSPPEKRGRTLSLASSIWGIASVLGPTLGGFLVTYVSWRWIFWLNIPLGIASFWGISAFLKATPTAKRKVSLDIWGAATLTTAILCFLFVFLLGGRTYPWSSLPIIGLLLMSLMGLVAFIKIESKAREPILSIELFKLHGFSAGNGVIFLSSFAIFSLFAFAPLYIQGVQGNTPFEVGTAMLAMSLGWSLGSIVLGQIIHKLGLKPAAVIGALMMALGAGLTLTFTSQSSVAYSFMTFFIVGLGMGFVSLATLMVVQNSVSAKDLGVATSSNQFARTLGGTVGVGVCGGLSGIHLSNLSRKIETSGIFDHLPPNLSEAGLGQIENVLRPEIQALMPPDLKMMVQTSVAQGTRAVFWAVIISTVLGIVLCALLPRTTKSSS